MLFQQLNAQPGSSCSSPKLIDFYDLDHYLDVHVVGTNGYWLEFEPNDDTLTLLAAKIGGSGYGDSIILYSNNCSNLVIDTVFTFDNDNPNILELTDLTPFATYALYFNNISSSTYDLTVKAPPSTVTPCNKASKHGFYINLMTTGYSELNYRKCNLVDLTELFPTCDCCMDICEEFFDTIIISVSMDNPCISFIGTDIEVYHDGSLVSTDFIAAGNTLTLTNVLNDYGLWEILTTFHSTGCAPLSVDFCARISEVVSPEITPSDTEICVGETVSFDVTSTNPDWETFAHRLYFGDGNFTYINQWNIPYDYIYTSPGIYQPYLESFDPNNQSCEDIIIYLDEITVIEPEVDFSYEFLSCYTIQFENNSVCFTDFIWYFGDGNSSNDEEPLHTYAESGTYDVILIGYNNNYLDWVIKPVSIEFPDAPILEEYSPILCDNEIFIEILNFDSNFIYYFDNYNNISKASMNGNEVYIVGNDLSLYASVELIVEDENGCTNSILIEFQPQCIIKDLDNVFCNATASEVISDLGLTNNTYASTQPILFNGIFTIDVDFNFQSAENVLFGPDARIEVLDGNELNIYRFSTLQSGCPYMWDGIKVQDGASLHIETSTVKDAQEAIRSEDGAYFHLNKANFIDNYVNLRVMPYHASHNHFVRDVHFYTDNGLLDPFYGENSAIGIEIIDNEDFVLEDNINHNINFDLIDTAIHVLNSNVEIQHVIGTNLDYGIVAHRPTAGLRDLSVLGDPKQGVELEGEVAGIYVDGYANVTIEDAKITDFNNGIWLRNGFWIGTVNIDGNQIIRCQTSGILLHELKQFTIFVNENEIDVQYSLNLGKGIVFNGLPEFNLDSVPPQGLPHILQITDNYINNYRLGIENINNGSLNTTIGGNEINMTKNDYLGVFYAKTTGIRVGNSVGNTYVICNQCTGDSYDIAHNLFGTEIEVSIANIIQKNINKNTGRGITARGVNAETFLRWNDFEDNFYGFELTDFGQISSQILDNQQLYYGKNRWHGSTFDAHLFASGNTDGTNIGFVLPLPGTNFHPTGFESLNSELFLNPIQYIGIDIFSSHIPEPTCPNSQMILSEGWDDYEVDIEFKAVNILNDTMFFEGLNDEQLWWAKNQIYAMIYLDQDSQLVYPEVDSFFQDYENSFYAQLLDWKHDLALLNPDSNSFTDYLSHEQDLFYITPTNAMEENMQFIAKLRVQSLNGQFTHVYNAYETELYALANQCPMDNGPGVYYAQYMLSASDTAYLNYLWADTCDASPQLRLAANENKSKDKIETKDVLKFESAIKFYPNPVRKGTAMRVESNEIGIARLWDFSGRMILETYINDGTNDVSIPTQIASGIYIFEFFPDNDYSVGKRLKLIILD